MHPEQDNGSLGSADLPGDELAAASPPTLLYRFGQRAFDVAFSAAVLVLTLPVLVAAAALIKLDSPGPVFFRQWRIGRGMKPFRILKLRTMVAGAETKGPPISVGTDPRVTRLGRLLRRYRLDELPNLVNVLLGHMSVVGPRPELTKYLPYYGEREREIFRYRPGLTDPATLQFRDEADLLARFEDPERDYVDEILPRKIELSLRFLRARSLRKDVRILLRTLAAVAAELEYPALIPRFLRFVFTHRGFFIEGVHLAIFTLSFLAAFYLRFGNEMAPATRNLMMVTLPLMLVIRALVFAWSRLYQGLWKYVSIWDMLSITAAVSASSLVFGAVGVGLFGYGFPPTVLVIDWLLCLAMVAGVRASSRISRELVRGYVGPELAPALIVGAGDAGEMLLRELDRSGAARYRVEGFLDDEPRLWGHRIHGIEVLGGVDRLPELCRAKEIEEVLIAIPSAGQDLHRRVVRLCQEANVRSKRVPTLMELLDGRATIGQLKEVRPEDLLGREAVRLDVGKLREELEGKSILVTGGAGTIGSEIARQVAHFGPGKLVLFDHGESGLYFIALELETTFPAMKVVPIVGDIRDGQLVSEVLREHRPEVIYHAAAYKHVPLMESQPLQAIENNLFGTEILARAARREGVRKFVFISSDKAVNPCGIMGMTKRAAECLLLGLSGGGTAFSMVRFGNVLGSNGSVLPLFQKQMAAGGPITITDPEATRYFMLVSEAAQLVLQAGAMGRGGEIFLLDMGKPIRIMEMAQNFIRLYGLEPLRDVPVKVVGLRSGERLTEELMTDGEDARPSGHEKILTVQNRSFDPERFAGELETLRRAVVDRDAAAARRQLRMMVVREASAEMSRPREGSA